MSSKHSSPRRPRYAILDRDHRERRRNQTRDTAPLARTGSNTLSMAESSVREEVEAMLFERRKKNENNSSNSSGTRNRNERNEKKNYYQIPKPTTKIVRVTENRRQLRCEVRSVAKSKTINVGCVLVEVLGVNARSELERLVHNSTTLDTLQSLLVDCRLDFLPNILIYEQLPSTATTPSKPSNFSSKPLVRLSICSSMSDIRKL
jgi:hypothetical protein